MLSERIELCEPGVEEQASEKGKVAELGTNFTLGEKANVLVLAVVSRIVGSALPRHL